MAFMMIVIGNLFEVGCQDIWVGAFWKIKNISDFKLYVWWWSLGFSLFFFLYSAIMSCPNSSLEWYCLPWFPLTVFKGLIPIRVQGLHIRHRTSSYMGDVGVCQDLVLPHLTPLKWSFGLLGPQSSNTHSTPVMTEKHNCYAKFFINLQNEPA